MADAWSTVVTREPEWDDYTRSRVFALMAWEAGRCGSCGNYDSLVAVEDSAVPVQWPPEVDPDGRTFVVERLRCLACGAVDLIRRDWAKDHEDDPEPEHGKYAPDDGQIFAARPQSEEA